MKEISVIHSCFKRDTVYMGAISTEWISGSLILSETLMELIFNPCGKFWWNPECPVSQIYSPHLHATAPGIFSDLLRSIQMLKRVWGAESNGKLPHLFIPSKTATLILVFAVKDLAFSRSAVLVPEFAVKDLPLGRTLIIMIRDPQIFATREFAKNLTTQENCEKHVFI